MVSFIHDCRVDPALCGILKSFPSIVDANHLSELFCVLDRIKICAGQPDPNLAKQVLVVMVRGIMFKLDFPYAHFATCGATANKIFPMCGRQTVG